MSDACPCHEKGLDEKPAAYRRALGLVVALNLGMGLIEMTSGLLAGSQALKADALDFLGDGAITGLGLLAIGWPAGARSRAALLQGLFLAGLAVGVLGTAAYRVFVAEFPEPGTMGVVGAVALLVNIACAALLVPHRGGDATVRAVWLFSRNDAIGNAAVILAAGAVAATGTPWPDLLVAFGMAALFLHAAVDILRDAMAELRAHTVPAEST